MRVNRKREFPICVDTGACCGKFFPPTEQKVYSITEWYADALDETMCFADGKETEKVTNEEECLVGLELRIFLTSSDWCEFQEQSFCQELFRYLDNLKIQKVKTHLAEEKD